MQNWVKGVGKGSGDLLLKFQDPLYISERLKLETLNLSCIQRTRGKIR